MRDVSPSSVLLVDDDASIRAFLSKQLEGAGFEIHEAADGIDGLVKLRNELPKVIISDLQMPRMAGIEFISVVRRRFPFIPVMVLSGTIPNDIPAEAQPDAWFEKGSLDFHTFLQILRDLVQKSPDRADLPQVVASPSAPSQALPVISC